jgi:hypothetical protein
MKALRSIDTYDKSITTTVNKGMQKCTYDNLNNEEDMKFELSGNYSLRITECVIEKAGRGEDIYPHWKTNLNGVKNNNYKFRLHTRLVTAILNRVNDMDITDVNNVYNIEGYTRLTTISQDGNRVIYHDNPHIQGRMWYDWAYVHFEEVVANGDTVERFYPAKVLGFIKFEERTEAVIQCTEKPLRWSRVKKNFLEKVVLGTNDAISTVTVPLSLLVHPLCVLPDYGGHGTSYLVVLPRRNWSRYFGEKICSD